MKQAFTRLCVRLGITGVTLHTLRHTFATNLVRNTGDIRAAQSILGHQDIRHTMIYAHTTADHVKEKAFSLSLPRQELPKKLPKSASEQGANTLKPWQTAGYKAVGAAGIEPATSTV